MGESEWEPSTASEPRPFSGAYLAFRGYGLGSTHCSASLRSSASFLPFVSSFGSYLLFKQNPE